MDEVLEQLKNGVRRFRSDVYPRRAELYAHAVQEAQRPHTLFIACADSRVDPVEITQSAPGEVFVLRNIGNLVPAYGEMMGGNSAVIEYAVAALGVRHVVICGHTDCGAMKALLDPASMDAMPSVKNWMTNAHAARTVAETLHEREPQIAARPLRAVLTEQNVLLQIQHLKTHPSVAGAMARGELTVSGWIYAIGTGEVTIAEDGDRTFAPVTSAVTGTRF